VVHSALDKITGDIKALQQQAQFKQFWGNVKNPDRITDMRNELDVALSWFQVCTI
jgi:hypothetical protein